MSSEQFKLAMFLVQVNSILLATFFLWHTLNLCDRSDWPLQMIALAIATVAVLQVPFDRIILPDMPHLQLLKAICSLGAFVWPVALGKLAGNGQVDVRTTILMYLFEFGFYVLTSGSEPQ